MALASANLWTNTMLSNLTQIFQKYTLVILSWAYMRYLSHVFATISHGSLLILLMRTDKFSQAISGKLDLWPPNLVLVCSPALTPLDLP